MRPFQFRLETLLKLRVATRDRAASALGEAQRAASLLEDQRSHLEYQREQLRQSKRRALMGEQHVAMLLAGDRFELDLSRQESDIVDKIRQVEREVARRRERLMEADRDVRGLEKVRDKAIEQHRIDELQREQNRLDDMATIRFDSANRWLEEEER
jgi:flagellar protein FliJ